MTVATNERFTWPIAVETSGVAYQPSATTAVTDDTSLPSCLRDDCSDRRSLRAAQHRDHVGLRGIGTSPRRYVFPAPRRWWMRFYAERDYSATINPRRMSILWPLCGRYRKGPVPEASGDARNG
jgi:hypothetical protein